MAAATDCLKNFIGIRQACTNTVQPAPRSGMYVEDYPGLTRTVLQSIEPGVWLNCQAFLDDMVRQATIQVIEVDAAKTIEPYLRTKDELEFGAIGKFDETVEMVTSSSARGLRVKKNVGILGRLLVGRFYAQSSTAGTFTVTVTDGSNPVTFEVVLEANVPKGVWCQYDTDADKVDITITDNLFTPVGGSTARTAVFSNCVDCGGTSTWKTLCGTGLLAGVENSGVEGIVAEAGIMCDIGPAVCLLAPRLKVPIFYATVVKILENWEATPRMNFFAQHRAEWLKATWTYLTEKQYPTAFDLHAKGLARFVEQLDPVCVTCGTGTSFGYAHP